jgi:hypothetical protein
MPSGTKRESFRQLLLAWWRGWKHKRQAVAELDCCGSEAEDIARDLGVAPGELRVLAAKRPDAASLLYQRLDSLKLDARRIAESEGATLHDLQRLCTACGSKARCVRDLAEHPSDPAWHSYCPNAGTLDALSIEAADAKAIARLERRQAIARRMQ